MIRHFLNYILFAFTMFAAGAPAVGGGDGGSGSTGSTTGNQPVSSQPSGSGSVGDGTSASATGATQPQGDQNIRQLREAYDGLKSKYEPWEKLGVKPDQVTQYQTGYQQVFGEVSNIASTLGYSEQDVAEAIQAKGLLPVLDFLRNQAWENEQAQNGDPQAQQTVNMREQMEELVTQTIGPIQQRENQRMTSEANALVDRTVHQLAVESFKAEGLDAANIPQDEMFMLTTAVYEILKYDEAALKAIKYEGKTAAVQQAFQEARNYLDKYYLARSGRDRARLQPVNNGGRPQQQQQNGKRPSLDEMIDSPELINAKYR